MSRILSVDPGDRTGLVLCDTDRDYAFSSWEVNDIDKMLREVNQITLYRECDLVIVEDFIINADTCKKKKPIRWPLEMVGAIRWICYQNNMPLIIQTPSQKDWMDDDKLKRLGWYKGSSKKSETEGHADDAARHCGYYLGVTRQERNFLRKLI